VESIEDRYLSREEAKVVDMTTEPSAKKNKEKKHRIGTLEGLAFLFAVLAFSLFWGWTLPSLKMVGEDQIVLTENLHSVYKDLTGVKNLLEQTRTDMDVRRLKEIQVVLDDLISRKEGNINSQAVKIKQDIDNLIKMLDVGIDKAPK
jgi:hypothetical protein